MLMAHLKKNMEIKMFEIKWKDKIYKFDEEISNAIFNTVKGDNLTQTDKLIIAMSVDPKITPEIFNDLPKLLLLKIGSKITKLADF